MHRATLLSCHKNKQIGHKNDVAIFVPRQTTLDNPRTQFFGKGLTAPEFSTVQFCHNTMRNTSEAGTNKRRRCTFNPKKCIEFNLEFQTWCDEKAHAHLPAASPLAEAMAADQRKTPQHQQYDDSHRRAVLAEACQAAAA
jgi:hypothetical protein